MYAPSAEAESAHASPLLSVAGIGSSTRRVAPVGIPDRLNENPVTWFDRGVVRHLHAALVIEVEADADPEDVRVVRGDHLRCGAAQAHGAGRHLREARREAAVARVGGHGGRRKRDRRARAHRVHAGGLADSGRRAVGAPVIAVAVPGSLDADRVGARAEVAVRIRHQRDQRAAAGRPAVRGRCRGRRPGGAGRAGRRGRGAGGRVVPRGTAARVVARRGAAQASGQRRQRERSDRNRQRRRRHYPVFHECTSKP